MGWDGMGWARVRKAELNRRHLIQFIVAKKNQASDPNNRRSTFELFKIVALDFSQSHVYRDGG